MRRLVVGVAAVCVALLVSGCQTLPMPPPGATGAEVGRCRPDPFTAEWRWVMGLLGAPEHHVTASVLDDRTGCWYHYNRGQRVTTASVVKAEIMAGVLLRAQRAGRGLTPTEAALVDPMIRVSDDRSASRLWSSLGASAGMDAIGRAFSLHATDERTPVWGLTSTTAEDQARFVSSLLQGPGPLDDAHRAAAWWYLRRVRHDQRWGVPTGVPAGWEVGNKNGFAGSACCGWRVNSVGYVSDPTGGGYALAVLSDRWPSLGAGVPTVDAVGRQVAATLTSS